MKVKVHYRKGEKNKKFKKIVTDVTDALKQLDSEGRIKPRLLIKLKKMRGPLTGAWQDADELDQLLGKHKYRFDIYNWHNKTAIEIEESEVKYIWKDLIKLSIGARRKKVMYGIIICPVNYRARKLKKPVKIYDTAIKITKFMGDLIWVKHLAIIGYV